MMCRWIAALCWGGRAGEAFKERDCFKGASIGCWRLNKGRPLENRECRCGSSLVRRSWRKRGVEKLQVGRLVSSHARAGRQADDKLESIIPNAALTVQNTPDDYLLQPPAVRLEVRTHVGSRRAIGRMEKSRWRREGGEVGVALRWWCGLVSVGRWRRMTASNRSESGLGIIEGVLPAKRITCSMSSDDAMMSDGG